MIDYDEKLSCPECRKIMDGATKKYKAILSKDELKSCRMGGLFNCIRTYKSNRGKFNTFLAYCVKWECLEQIKFNIRGSGQYEVFDPLDKTGDKTQFDIIEDVKTLCHKNNLNSRVFLLKYLYGNTIHEISDISGVTEDRILKNNGRVRKLLKLVYN